MRAGKSRETAYTPPLPWLLTVGRAYLAWLRDIKMFLRVAFGWMALAALSLFALVGVGVSLRSWFAPPGSGTALPLVLTILIVSILIIMASGIGVGWYRYLLLGELPSELLELSHRRLRLYLRRAFAVAILWVTPLVVIELATQAAELEDSASFPTLVLALVFYCASLRFNLAFASAAIEGPLTLRASWKATRGKALLLVLADAMILVPVVAAAFAIVQGLDVLNDLVSFPLRIAAIVVCVVMYAGLAATLTSLLYRSVIGGTRDEDLPSVFA